MSFATFVKAITGYQPFPWQLELAEGDWNDITVPTGCGKTVVVLAWLYRLSRGTAPTRMVYVVDRRVIVDDVFRFAAEAATAIDQANDGILRDVADAIKERHAVSTPVLVARLRGGTWRDESWAQSPSQPILLVSTVDQAGSRLLCRGYGCSRSMQIVSAGLLGNDVIYVVDESHLASAFVSTLRRVIEMHPGSIYAPPILVEMTATPRDELKSIGLTDADFAHPELSKRIGAKKPTKLAKVAVPDASELEKRNHFAPKFVAEALKLPGQVVAVIVNSVALARTIHTGLLKHGEAILITGRSRPHERDEMLRDYRARIMAGRDRSEESPRLYVVSTQCIEAGVDCDFDALITELGPLDAIRQRVGRLNRLGVLEQSPCVLLARSDKVKANAKDFIYGGKTLGNTWRWLWERRKNLDLGLQLETPEGEELTEITSPKHEFAILEPWDVEHLAAIQSPLSVDLSDFLHEVRKGNHQTVGLCWRDGLGEISSDRRKEINATLAALPPRVGEICNVPLWESQKWLDQSAIRWTEDGAEIIEPNQVSAGDVIIVPAVIGGCDRWGWAPDSQEPVEDIGDDVAWRSTGKRVKRSYKSDRPNEGSAKRLPIGWLITFDWEQHPLDEFARVTPREATATNTPVPLESHCRGVGVVAESFALEQFKESYRIAGELHDAGKADARWQYAISGGEFSTELFAKSGDLPFGRYLVALEQSGLPKGWRHETLSVLLAEQLTDDPLVLHLIASHHGYGHPWVGITIDPEPPDVELDICGNSLSVGSIDRDEHCRFELLNRCAERYDQLNNEYGVWQRCMLESALILADWRQSAADANP